MIPTGFIPITVATPPDELIETRNGRIPYAEWLKLEMERIGRRSKRALAIYTNPKTGEVALAEVPL